MCDANSVEIKQLAQEKKNDFCINQFSGLINFSCIATAFEIGMVKAVGLAPSRQFLWTLLERGSLERGWISNDPKPK